MAPNVTTAGGPTSMEATARARGAPDNSNAQAADTAAARRDPSTIRNSVTSVRFQHSTDQEVVTVRSPATQAPTGQSDREIANVTEAKVQAAVERQQMLTQTRGVMAGILNRRADQLAALAEQLSPAAA